MVKLDYSKVVRCPEQDMDVNICDCTGCDFYVTTDDFSEFIECAYVDGDWGDEDA